jgi:hypothetical protein
MKPCEFRRAENMNLFRTLRRDFSSFRIIGPVPKIGIQMPLSVSPIGYRQLNRRYPSARRERSGKRHSQPPMVVKLSMLKFGLLKILALLCPEFRGPQNIKAACKRAQAMPAITPQEFLF